MSRKWNSLIRIAETDSFAKSYTVSGVAQTNANGDDFFGLDVAVNKWTDELNYRRAEKLWENIESGRVKASTEDLDNGSPGTGNSEY